MGRDTPPSSVAAPAIISVFLFVVVFTSVNKYQSSADSGGRGHVLLANTPLNNPKLLHSVFIIVGLYKAIKKMK